MARTIHEGAQAYLPEERTLPALRAASRECRGCDLWERGSQTVFGEGPREARLLFVGEQPGNDEDLEGRPFVGPAGRLLEKALTEAGIARDEVYLTNVVKHFKWEPQGKRRIHAKPDALQVAACRPWLEAELAAVKPELVVCLGATAAQALLGRTFRVTQRRGEVLSTPFAPRVPPDSAKRRFTKSRKSSPPVAPDAALADEARPAPRPAPVRARLVGRKGPGPNEAGPTPGLPPLPARWPPYPETGSRRRGWRRRRSQVQPLPAR